MNIEEADLVDFVKNKAVKKITIVQLKNGKYKLVVNLTWKPGDFTLVAYRKKPREWTSLDTLSRHIRQKYNGHTLPINLSLMPFELEGEQKQETNLVIDQSD